MPKNVFLIILLLIFLSSLANAQIAQLPNGSFETGDLTNWTVDYNNTDSTSNCQASGYTGSYSVGNFTPTDGMSSLQFVDSDTTNPTGKWCYQLTNTLSNFSGVYRFYVDVNIVTTAGNCQTDVCKVQFRKNKVPQSAGLPPVCEFQGPIAPLTSAAGTLICDFNGVNFNMETFLWSQAAAWTGTIRIDNFRYEQIPKLTHNVQEEGDPFPVDTNFSITDALYLDTNNMVVPDANCTINFDGVNSAMQFNTSIQKYEFTYQTSTPKTVFYGIGCSHSGLTSQGTNAYAPPDSNILGSVTFVTDLSTGNKLTVTDISNVTHEIVPLQVNFFPTSELNDIIFSIQNNYTSSLDVPQHVFNSLIDGRQYFIYTANQTQFNSGIWVFNDSLTFGVSQNDPIQKIFDENLGVYDYSYTDTILVGQKKFYKLVYKNPYKNFQTIGNSTDWYTVLAPQVFDGNSIDTDIYQISAFSNIRSIYIPFIPDIFGDENSAFEFQFTAWSDANTVTLSGGQTLFDSDSTTSVTLSTEPHRYSFTINGTNFNSQVLLKSNSTSPHTVYIYDYTIVPRGYFTKRLELFKENGDVLDLFLINGDSKKFLQEGNPFLIKAQAYDREGLLTQLKVESFFDQTGDDINKVSYYITDLSTESEKTFDFQQLVNGIVDLNGNATFPTQHRDLILKATVYDTLGNAISEQSQPIKFVQFPYFGGDFFLQFFPTEKRKGKNPAGILQIDTKNIDALEGLDIRIYDQNSSITSPDYQKRIYKGTDFDCLTGTCSFNIKIDDFLYEDANLAHFVVTGLMNTEYFSLTNPLVQVDRTIFLSQTTFDVARIQQFVERTNQEYKNSEEIPVVLILRSTDAEDLTKNLNVYLTLQNCDNNGSGANCTQQTTKWYPTGKLFDDKYNYNYFFFRNIFLLDNGSLLPDGNYIGFRATVLDNTGVINPVTPVLAPRCKGFSYTVLFWPGAFYTYLANLFTGAQNGCSSGTTDDVVTTVTNSSQEMRILINNATVLTDPSLTAFGCLAPDTNNIQADALSQDLLCVVWVQSGKKPIDNYRIRVGNSNSDYSEKGANKQFVEFNIPYELVAYNDPLYVKNQLDESADIITVGDYIYEGFRQISVDVLNATIIDKASFLSKNGFIPQIAGDINLDLAFSPTSVGQIFWIDIKGAPIVNAQNFKNYSQISGSFDSINRKRFLEYLSSKGVAYQTTVPAVAKVIINDFSLPTDITDLNGAILIDQVPTEKKINQGNVDVNTPVPYGALLPAKITLTLSSTMFYNNESQQQTMSLLLNIYAFFFQKIGDFFAGIVNGLVNPNPNSDPVAQGVGLLYSNILYIIVSLGFIYTAVVIRDRYYGRR